MLSQKLVRLFLFAENGIVSLEAAALQLKTKMRRLYDIANILCSLQLIVKAAPAERTRKPAFKWIYDEATYLIKTRLESRKVEAELSGRKRGSGAISGSKDCSKKAAKNQRTMKQKSVSMEESESDNSALDKLASVAHEMFGTQPNPLIPKPPLLESSNAINFETSSTSDIQSYLTKQIASLQSLLSQISQRQTGDGDKPALPREQDENNQPEPEAPVLHATTQKDASSIETPILTIPSVCF